MNAIDKLINGITQGDFKTLARALTLVENDIKPSDTLLRSLSIKKNVTVLGVTGPPGAGKSTLVNAIINNLKSSGKRIAILAVDPTSPFNFGSLLGDRIRMGQQFNDPNIYIRSIATRGTLGGVSVKTLEMIDVLRSSNFDLIIVETVGVGQSEVEIAGLADKTLVVLVPESGDEIQNIKSGLMEIAQGFVVNKADRAGADIFAHNLKKMVHEQNTVIPVFKTVADKEEGVAKLCEWIMEPSKYNTDRKNLLITEKAFKIIQHHRMKDIDKTLLRHSIENECERNNFNVYKFSESWINNL